MIAGKSGVLVVPIPACKRAQPLRLQTPERRRQRILVVAGFAAGEGAVDHSSGAGGPWLVAPGTDVALADFAGDFRAGVADAPFGTARASPVALVPEAPFEEGVAGAFAADDVAALLAATLSEPIAAAGAGVSRAAAPSSRRSGGTGANGSEPAVVGAVGATPAPGELAVLPQRIGEKSKRRRQKQRQEVGVRMTTGGLATTSATGSAACVASGADGGAVPSSGSGSGSAAAPAWQ